MGLGGRLWLRGRGRGLAAFRWRSSTAAFAAQTAFLPAVEFLFLLLVGFRRRPFRQQLLQQLFLNLRLGVELKPRRLSVSPCNLNGLLQFGHGTALPVSSPSPSDGGGGSTRNGTNDGFESSLREDAAHTFGGPRMGGIRTFL